MTANSSMQATGTVGTAEWTTITNGIAAMTATIATTTTATITMMIITMTITTTAAKDRQ
jgi:hypothetical protein